MANLARVRGQAALLSCGQAGLLGTQQNTNTRGITSKLVGEGGTAGYLKAEIVRKKGEQQG